MNKMVLNGALVAMSLLAGQAGASTLIGDTATFQLAENLNHFGPDTQTTLSVNNGTGLSLSPLKFSISSAGDQRNTLKDTVRIDVTAKDGYAITGVSLLESGTFTLGDDGKAKIKAKLAILDNDRPGKKLTASKEKSFSATDDGSWSVVLDKNFKNGKYATSISLFITDKLMAKAGKDGQDSTLSLLLAELNIKTVRTGSPTAPAAVPLLPALWFMVPGIIGLFALGRNKRPA